MRISTSTTIERPASDVWDLLGRRFGEASTWASSISASQAVGEPTIAGDRAGGASAGSPYPADHLVEELVAYDDAAMTLTYRLAEGMQQVARSAHNTWSVVPLGETTSQLRIEAEVDLAPTGRALGFVLRPYLSAMGRRNADDFKTYVETGRPSERKRRQETGGSRLATLVAGNAVFTAVSGAVLVVGSGWWANQLGGVAAPIVAVLGTSLMAYAVVLAWISGGGPARGPDRRWHCSTRRGSSAVPRCSLWLARTSAAPVDRRGRHRGNRRRAGLVTVAGQQPVEPRSGR